MTTPSANPNTSGATGSAINIVFDGPPGPEAGRFVEVETDDGKSINIGEWSNRPDGYWVLRITQLPNAPAEARSDRRLGPDVGRENDHYV